MFFLNYFIKYNSPLQKRRVTKGYSQQEMSKHLDITQSQYSRIEKGNSDPNKHVKKLSEIFGCDPNEVFQGEILNEIENNKGKFNEVILNLNTSIKISQILGNPMVRLGKQKFGFHNRMQRRALFLLS